MSTARTVSHIGSSSTLGYLTGYTARAMMRYVVLDKRVGQTPLATIRTWKQKNTAYADISACYAGRLDPMASGKLLVLLGEECKQLHSYTHLDKEYDIEVLLDISSDSGDVLGLPTYSGKETFAGKNIIHNILYAEQGSHLRAYPAFSSKTVNGKPLFLYALEGTLSQIQVPMHLETIYRIQFEGSSTISGRELAKRVEEFLAHVPRTDEPSKRLGEDFRVDAVQTHWQPLLRAQQGRDFCVLRLRVACASGTYMRSLAGRIGSALGTNALALSIRRTRIGKYISLWRGIGWWLWEYR